jgi:hypothetical protein
MSSETLPERVRGLEVSVSSINRELAEMKDAYDDRDEDKEIRMRSLETTVNRALGILSTVMAVATIIQVVVAILRK